MAVEIEIKSLLGEATVADRLRSALVARGAQLVEVSQQLNHYFIGGTLPELTRRAETFLPAADHAELRDITARARKASVRTRLLNETVLLIVKAALDHTTSANGITRLEFEKPAPSHTLDALDAEVQAAGFEYQAKWSRLRHAYRLDNVTISLDKNAGYGWLAEFEITAEDDTDAAESTAYLRGLMADFGVRELRQDLLERMFAYYNAHWREYYGTEKTFSIE